MAGLFNRASNDRIEYGVSADFDDLTALTVSAWIYVTSLANDGVIVAKHSVDNPFSSPDLGFFFFVDVSETNDELGAFIGYDNTTSSSDWIKGGAAISVNTWHHVLLRWKTTERSLWLDGVEGTVNTVARTQISNTAADLWIGAADYYQQSAIWQPFNGRIAGVAIWKNAWLDDNEVKALARGVNEFGIRPQALTMPVPFWTAGDIHAIGRSRYAGTDAGTGIATANGPPVAPFSRRFGWGTVPLIETGAPPATRRVLINGVLTTVAV